MWLLKKPDEQTLALKSVSKQMRKVQKDHQKWCPYIDELERIHYQPLCEDSKTVDLDRARRFDDMLLKFRDYHADLQQKVSRIFNDHELNGIRVQSADLVAKHNQYDLAFCSEFDILARKESFDDPYKILTHGVRSGLHALYDHDFVRGLHLARFMHKHMSTQYPQYKRHYEFAAQCIVDVLLHALPSKKGFDTILTHHPAPFTGVTTVNAHEVLDAIAFEKLRTLDEVVDTVNLYMAPYQD